MFCAGTSQIEQVCGEIISPGASAAEKKLAKVILRLMDGCLRVYISILVLSCFMWSGVLDSSDILL